MTMIRPCIFGWRTLALVVVLGAALVSLGAVPPQLEDTSPVLLGSTGRFTFAELGWSEDVTISDGSPAVVEFRLPEGTEQGNPLWYGLHLKFRWSGLPGHEGDYVFLNGSWNKLAVYQFKVKRITELDGGFRWSVADIVNGTSRGYETSETMVVASTNMAQRDAVRGGLNTIRLSLDLLTAGNPDVVALVSNQSEVVVTSWQPTRIDGTGNADVDGKVVDLVVNGKNLGWGAHNLSARALVWSGPHMDVFKWDLGRLEPLGSFTLQKQLILADDRVPHRIDVELEWGSGRQFYTLWDAGDAGLNVPFLGHGIFRSTVGLLIAVSVLWIALPALVAALRQSEA